MARFVSTNFQKPMTTIYIVHSTLQIVVKNIDSGVTYNISVEFLRVLSRGSSVHRVVIVISNWTLPKAKGKGSGYLLGTVS